MCWAQKAKMKLINQYHRSIVIFFALLLTAATLRSEDLPKPLLAEMDAFGAKISQAFADKDIDAIMSCYWNSPDVQLIALGDYVRGTEALRQANLALFAFPGTIRNECLSIKYTRVGELILVVGTERNTMTPDDTRIPTIYMDLIWSDVRKKVDGKWVMLLNHVTMLPAPAPTQ
jgi:ketosteroid isomerase-like protein